MHPSCFHFNYNARDSPQLGLHETFGAFQTSKSASSDPDLALPPADLYGTYANP